MGLQGVLYREYLLASSLKIIDWINKYCKFLILFLPSIALLPFSTDSYDTNDYPFCTMSGVVWNFTVLYGFVWMILLPSLVMVSRTIFKVYRGNPELGNKLFARIGLYYMITLVSWIPRTAYRIIEYMGGHPSLTLCSSAFDYVLLRNSIFCHIYQWKKVTANVWWTLLLERKISPARLGSGIWRSWSADLINHPHRIFWRFFWEQWHLYVIFVDIINYEYVVCPKRID